jgi:hypothetical protein
MRDVSLEKFLVFRLAALDVDLPWIRKTSPELTAMAAPQVDDDN